MESIARNTHRKKPCPRQLLRDQFPEPEKLSPLVPRVRLQPPELHLLQGPWGPNSLRYREAPRVLQARLLPAGMS